MVLKRSLAVAGLLMTMALGAQAADKVLIGAFDVGPGGNPQKFNPLTASAGFTWYNKYFNTLALYDVNFERISGDLAQGWSVSPDGKAITFNLRKGVKFHNGRELKSADVKYTFERLVNPETQSPGQGYYAVIEGFDEMVSGAADGLSGVTTPDDYTVVINLTRPNAVFLNVLAMHFSSIVPQEEVEKYGADWGRNPVGTGAYKITEWTLGQRIVFERNPDYQH